MLGITDPLAAFNLDVAVFVSGRMAENEEIEARRGSKYGANPSDYRRRQRPGRSRPQAGRQTWLNMAREGGLKVRKVKQDESVWP